MKALVTGILGAVIYALFGWTALLWLLLAAGVLFAIAGGLEELERHDKQKRPF